MKKLSSRVVMEFPAGMSKLPRLSRLRSAMRHHRLAFHIVVILGGLLALLSAVAGPSQRQPQIGTIPEDVSSQPPRTPEQERRSFHLPPGFEVQLVAAEPYVHKPINISFDDRGRLWVTESVEYPFPAKPGTHPRDTVRIFQDTNGDGLADEVTTFADGLNIPIGVLPITKGAIVYSIPYIYRLLDIDGDDRADQRQVLYGTFGHIDTHGMTGNFIWGFDGWIYACHGYANDSVVKGSDGKAISMNSGNVYRMKPDGSHVEYFTHGQVNPFGLTFDPLGNLYSCDCETRPVYMLLRGAYYPSFGKPDDGLGFGPEMIHHGHGSTAIAGIAYYAADHFPPAYRDTFFIGNVVTNRINRDRLVRHGSTFEAVQTEDFLISDDPWFRPVCIQIGPDGALYVADFYNRIIGHYEVPLTHPGRDHSHGRIWRIVYRGPDGKARPPIQPRADWAKATVPELVQDLAHPNLVVRLKATNQLVERGGQAGISAVRKVMHTRSSPWQRMHGLWVLDRLGALDDPTLAAAAKDPAVGVRVHAMRVLSERPKLPDFQWRLVLAGLKDKDACVQRVAADALGMHPAPANIRPLLDLRHTVPAEDSHLLHVVRMALRNQLRPAKVWAQLLASSWSEREARAIADVAPGVHRSEAAAFLMKHLEHVSENRANQVRYVNHIARYGAKDLHVHLLQFARGQQAAGLGHQLALFKAIQDGFQARGASLGNGFRGWAQDLARSLLSATEESEVLAGIELAGSLKMTSAAKVLANIARNHQLSEARRAAAMAALVAINPAKQIPLLSQLLDDGSEPLSIREKAANTLGGINQAEARQALVKSLAVAPERLAVPIAVALAANPDGIEQLLQSVAAGKASARLLLERPVEVKLAQAQLPHLQERLGQLTLGLPPADARMQELMKRRHEGFVRAKPDRALGAKVFEKHCAVCHRLADKGAKIGPQLDGIGIRGLDRLLEDIMDPNRNVDQSFRQTTLNLKNGQIVSGLVLREEGQVLVLADSQGKEVRVPRREIEERILSQLSSMPANLADQIPEADFYNLLAFLLDQKPSQETRPRHAAGPGSR